MKFTIEGFQQQALLDMKLDCIDSVILRYVVDFYSTGQMYHKIIDNKVFFWLNYSTVINEIPIIGISKPRYLAARFDKYVECGLMEKVFVKGQDEYLNNGKKLSRRGSFTYFHINPVKMITMVREPESAQPKIDPYTGKQMIGLLSKPLPFEPQRLKPLPSEQEQCSGTDINGVTAETPTKDSSTNDYSSKDDSINDVLLNHKIVKNFIKEGAKISITENTFQIEHKYSEIMASSIRKLMSEMKIEMEIKYDNL